MLNPPLSESVLLAEPLIPMTLVSVDTRTENHEYWSDGRFFDPHTPIHVPFRDNKKVKVVYWDYADYGYYLQDGELKWRSGDSYNKLPVFEYPMEYTKAYHEFNCLQLEVFFVKKDETDITFVLFQDIQTSKWYVVYSTLTRIKSGSYISNR